MPTIVLRRSTKTLTPAKKKPKRGLSIPSVPVVRHPAYSKSKGKPK